MSLSNANNTLIDYIIQLENKVRSYKWIIEEIEIKEDKKAQTRDALWVSTWKGTDANHDRGQRRFSAQGHNHWS